MTTASRLWHCDEMRFGLWGQVRRRWGLKGKKIIQPMQIVFRWSYLVLAVDVGRGELHWGWSQGMNQQQLVPIFEQWPMDGVVWDGAPSHRGKLMGQLGFGRISLPAYSPELNPAERVFEEVRRHIEGWDWLQSLTLPLINRIGITITWLSQGTAGRKYILP